MQTNSNIMANKKYSLAIEKIDEAAKEFIAAHPIYTLHIKDCNQGKQKQIEIVNTKSQEKGILNCYITVGQVSHNIQGKQGTLNGMCESCWEIYCRTDSHSRNGSEMLQIERCKTR